MDEEFIVKVTEEELAQFPERGRKTKPIRTQIYKDLK